MMHIAGHAYDVLTAAEVALIHDSALRILAEMGMEVENDRLLGLLAEFGLPVDRAARRVRFPSALVERYIAEAEKHDWAGGQPQVHGAAGVYYGLYHEPTSGEIGPWTEEALISYIDLAHRLPHVGSVGMFGTRVPVPERLEPLYERYYCWQYGASEAGTIHLDELCPHLLELYEARAAEQGRPLAEVFRGTVYLQSPLKLGLHEAYQVAWFLERGLRVGIGDMWAMGTSAPVTLAGAATLNLAEQLALGMLNWAWFGEKRLVMGCAMAGLDMRTMIYPFGRPEMGMANLIGAQLARHYGAHFAGHGGLADAKLPSAEAGAQKALTAIPTLLAAGSAGIDCGGLSSGDLCSPIQMVLDNELVGALKRFTHEFRVDEEAIGLDTILHVGPGGHFTDTPHTVTHFRGEHWEPSIWSRELLQPWLQSDRRLDVDRARDLALAMQGQRQGEVPRGMSEGLEQEALGIIERARRKLL